LKIRRCCIGKNGIKKRKIEGDKTTPRGRFGLKTLYYRKDRLIKPNTVLETKVINKNMGWCNDSSHRFYNKEMIKQKIFLMKYYLEMILNMII